MMGVCSLLGKMMWGNETEETDHIESRTEYLAKSPYTRLHLTDGRKSIDEKKAEERGTVWYVWREFKRRRNLKGLKIVKWIYQTLESTEVALTSAQLKMETTHSE